MFDISEVLLVLKEQNVNKLRCVIITEGCFFIRSLLLFCSYQAVFSEGQACIFFVVLCYIGVSVCGCFYTSGSVESLSVEIMAIEGFVKMLC